MAVCKACKQLIYWKVTSTKKWMPTNPDGSPHWVTCPFAKEFAKEFKSK